MKATMHKGCSCTACMRGKHTKSGHFTQNQNERKLRRQTKRELKTKDLEEVMIGPISTPYTD